MTLLLKLRQLLFVGLLCIGLALATNVQAQNKAGSVGLDIKGPVGEVDRNAPVSASEARKFYRNCTNHLPVGFSPDTHDEFCTCASVTIGQVMTNGELEAALGKIKRGDPYFEMSLIKYVQDVAVPCMDTAIRTLGYAKCLETRSHDNRIRSFPAYCSCVGDIAGRMLRERGANDIVGHYTGMEMNAEYTPEESFIRSPIYQNYVRTGIQACIQPAFMQWR